MRIARYFILFTFCCFFSCSKETDYEDLIRIVSPVSGWTYYEDSTICFSSNVNSENIYWYSSKDGFLGRGNGRTVFLSEGVHDIICKINDYKKNTIIQVQKRNYRSGQSIDNYINEAEKEILLKPGKYYPYLVSFEGKGKELKINKKTKEQLFNRDFKININLKNLEKIKNSANRAAVLNEYKEGEKKEFYIIKTDNQYDKPHEIVFEMVCNSLHCTVWLPEKRNFEIQIIENCIEQFNTLIYPRLKAIWGEWADVDQDGKIALVFCPTINEEKEAVGYFNPSDLFKNDDNNYSNEMDIIYLAVPEKNVNNYSEQTITATIAHEMTHAITFNSKTYKRVKEGLINIPQEEIYIEEGLSHLSENLCGFGISGGNVEFIRYYLENTQNYSFCTDNIFGQDDSVGQRGAMCLFLSWLFWKKGGMSWNVNNPSEVIDCGGISFLKKLINSSEIGWINIGKIYGVDIEEVFLEFVKDINLKRLEKETVQYRRDPVTEEYVEFFCSMPELHLGLPKVSEECEIRTVLPWSLILFPEFEIEEKQIINLSANKYEGKVFFNLIYNN
ncbi:MAG: hypothetical protein IKX23_00600 [Treponema sp.]|nr:hypothetical protein [Treponema sp.]